MPNVLFATRNGYLASTGDDSGTTVTDVGHVFGRFGEGRLNYPGIAKPFYWGTSATANTPTINVSLFPNKDTTTGLDSPSKEVVIEGMAEAWIAIASFDVPSQPVAPELPNGSSDGAVYLGSCLVVAVAIASSLY